MKYIVLYDIDTYLEEGGGINWKILDSMHKVKSFIKYKTKVGIASNEEFSCVGIHEIGEDLR